MNIEFDPAKDASNISKHSVSLALADTIEWETLWAKPDTRCDYGEIRMIVHALIGTRLYCVNERRIISLRKANQREVKNYVVNF